MDWANTIARRDEKHLGLGIWCDFILIVTAALKLLLLLSLTGDKPFLVRIYIIQLC